MLFIAFLRRMVGISLGYIKESTDNGSLHTAADTISVIDSHTFTFIYKYILDMYNSISSFLLSPFHYHFMIMIIIIMIMIINSI